MTSRLKTPGIQNSIYGLRPVITLLELELVKKIWLTFSETGGGVKQNLTNENDDIAIAMSSSRADPVLGH